MTDKPRKTLTIIRKPTTASPTTGNTDTPVVQRTGKRIIRREELSGVQRTTKPPAPKPQPTKPKQKKKPPRKPKKPVVKPSDLKAKELNDRLNGFLVWLHYKPLAIGTDKDIFRLVGEECFSGASKKVVQKVLHQHTNHGRYLQNLMVETHRYRLDGTPDGEVNAHQRQLAAETIAKRTKTT